MRTLTVIFLCSFAISCGQSDKRASKSLSGSIPNPTVNNEKFTSLVDSISSNLLCKPIDTVNKMFTNIKDSIFESEGVEWPGKVVTHSDGSWIIFETSWTDKAKIWRIKTNSKSMKFPTPYMIGDSVGKIKKDGYRFTFNEGDGGEYYFFVDERIKNVGFLVEEKYSRAFYKNAFSGQHDPMKHLNSKAKITELSIRGNCDNNSATSN
jgi:hypothetical protein